MTSKAQNTIIGLNLLSLKDSKEVARRCSMEGCESFECNGGRVYKFDDESRLSINGINVYAFNADESGVVIIWEKKVYPRSC